jgi:hypothetical protein
MLILTLLCLTLATIVLAVSVRNLRGTTLVTAGGWSIAGVVVWWLAVVCGNLNLAGNGAVDVLFYATAVLLLCPGIAVLGARRPGAGAWNFFVLLPLLAVLLWPALASSQLLQAADASLELESPTLIGFALVLIMGVGNYFGTRFTLPSLLHAATLILIVASMSPSTAGLLPGRDAVRHWASLTFALAVVVASLRAGDAAQGLAPLDRLWLDFVDQFGLVWSKRVMDRLNETARHENWSAEFQWHRIHWNPDATSEEQHRTMERVEHTIRWLFKRFVEPEWIDGRLNETDAPQESPPAPDQSS